MRSKFITGLVTLGLGLMITGCTDTPQRANEVIPTALESVELEETQSSVEETKETVESSEEEAEPIPEPVITRITISFAGDCSLGNHHKQDYANSFRKEYDTQTPDYFLANVADIFAADDMTLVNYEGVATFYNVCNLADAYNIKGDPEYVKILTQGNVEAVSLANNHALDYGTIGRDDTVAALEGEGITYAYNDVIGIYETQGIRIGYIAFSGVDSGLGKDMKAKVLSGLEALDEAGADIKIVCLHWGIETNNYPESNQIAFGHEVLDMGADLLIGHHPHVLQGIEEYHGKFIVYSLGNFCFGANRSPKDKDTMIFQQSFTFVDGVLQPTMEAKVIPCRISSVNERNNYQPTPQEGEEALRIINRVNEYSASFDTSFDEEGYYVTKENDTNE